MGGNGNGHKPITNPMIDRMLAEQQQQSNLTQAMFMGIPGQPLAMSIEGIIEVPTPEGVVKLAKIMWALPSGPVVGLMDLDFAERHAKSILQKVRVARSGLTVIGDTQPQEDTDGS